MERTPAVSKANALSARLAFRATLAISSLLVLIAALDVGGFRADFL